MNAPNIALTRDQLFLVLARIRREFNLYQVNTAARSGYATAALALLSNVEAFADPDQLWTSCPHTEEELKGNLHLGDHLAVTRHVLGFCI